MAATISPISGSTVFHLSSNPAMSTPRVAGPTSPMTRRRRSSLGGTPTLSLPQLDDTVQQALSSDEFVQQPRKRRGAHQPPLNSSSTTLLHHESDSALAPPKLSRNSRAIAMPAFKTGSSTTSASTASYGSFPSSNSSFSSLASSPSSVKTLKPSIPVAAEKTSVTKRQSAARSYASNQRSRSRPRSPRTLKGRPISPGAPPSPSLSPSASTSPSASRSPSPCLVPVSPVLHRSISSSSCPEPRGATLSLGPSTSVPRTTSVSAEGQVGISTNLAAVEVLTDLRAGRSVPSSEYGDDEHDRLDDESEDKMLVYDCTAPISIPDLPPTDPDYAARAASLPSPRSPSNLHPGLVPLHPSGRPSVLRNHSSPPIPAASEARTLDGLRRSVPTSPMSSSPPREPSMLSAPVSPMRALESSNGLVLGLGIENGPSTRGRGSSQSSIGSNQGGHPSSTSRSVRPRPLGDEKRARRGSNSSQKGTKDASSEPQRPSLHTYTSFESAFDVAPPPSPPASPKNTSKGWPWQRA